jgi:RNA polymerase sigma factor (sigma-70 family)
MVEERTWFDPLVRRLGGRAFRFAYMMIGNVEIAEEIVQEAFARAWASPNTPSAEADFRRWLYRVIANLARDYHRQRGRFNNLPIPPAPSLDPLEQIDRLSEEQQVLAALRKLNVRERQAVFLRYFEDQSFADTARMMGSPEVSVRVLVHRALGKLRRHLEATGLREVAI